MRPIAIALLVAAAPLIAAAQSQVIYQSFVPNAFDNLNPTPASSMAGNSLYVEAWRVDTPFGIFSVSAWAATSYTPTQTFQLDSITIPLTGGGGVGDEEQNRRLQNLFWFGVYSDANGAPNQELLKLVNPSVSPGPGLIPNPMPGSTFTSPATFTMTAGTTYWFVMGPNWENVTTADGSSWWAWYAFREPIATGGGSVRSAAFMPTNDDWLPHTATGWGAPDTTYSDWQGGMSIVGTPVPEPSTYAVLAGLSALGLVLWRRRNVNDKKQVKAS